ncbi:MAG: MDR family oxidoreductase [Gammaproteobacteria bacterium]
MTQIPDTFSAIVVDRPEGRYQAEFRELSLAELPDQGDVVVRVRYSTINYKDALAVTGKGRIARKFPIVPGIDLAGEVVESESDAFKPGDPVLVTGCEIGEVYWGGYSQYARMNSQWLVPIPEGLDARLAMGIGTAGFTAMLAVMALEHHGVDRSGEVVVTGAAGGVGSVALALLAKAGFQQILASTGRPEEEAYLKSLGATGIIDRSELDQPAKPLESQRWAAAIDVVGGQTLSKLISQMQCGGAVAVCGLAGGTELHTSVYPIILRGVSVLGINSVYIPHSLRLKAWERVAKDLPLDLLESMIRDEPFRKVPELSEQVLAGKVRGRIVVDMG